jgi:hypothetical protein
VRRHSRAHVICDLVGEAPTRESAGTIRGDIADLMTRIDETERRTELFPHKRKYQLLVIGFLRRLLELHLELVDEIERELAPQPSRAQR